MTKRIILVRHGKSDHVQGIKDFDRSLNMRGHQDALSMAQKMLKKKLIPESLLSSPATRALTTAKHFAKVWNIESSSIETDFTIYEANTTALLKTLNNLSNGLDVIALFGHNPGLTEFANYLSNADIYNIPTAGIVIIDFKVKHWAEVSRHTGNLLLFDFPKNTEDPH